MKINSHETLAFHTPYRNFSKWKTVVFTLLIIVLTVSMGEAGFSASEPEVKIGIQQKIRETELSFSGHFHVFRVEDNRELYKGKDSNVKVALYAVSLRQLQDMVRVSLGKFRSFEQAEYTASTLKDLGIKYTIAQPGQWSLWFGPFKTESEAKVVQKVLHARGYFDTNIEPVPQDISVISLSDSNGKLIHLGNTPVLFVPTSGSFSLNGRKYRGSAEIALDAYGGFSVVNRVKVEDYLYSVLPKEMPPLSHPEALKSQAIIARTYLMKNKDRHQVDGFNLCDSTDCQVYGGMSSENAATTQAADSTRGMLLKDGDEVVNALFYSTCGGRTAAYTDSWNGDAPKYLVSVNDGTSVSSSLNSENKLKGFLNKTSGYCDTSKYFRWEKTYTYNELQEVFERTVPEFSNKPDLKFGKLKDVNITEYLDSGRAERLEITSDSGKYVFEKDAIRWVMGSTKSTMFYIEKKGKGNGRKYILHGAGWGHGVGLCQIGAMNMAKKGFDHVKILNHYYPGAEIVREW